MELSKENAIETVLENGNALDQQEKVEASILRDDAQEEGIPNLSGLSKRARKRLKKRQDWLDTKQERRALERAKRKAKMEQKRKENCFEMSYSQSRKKLKECKMADSECKVSVVVDMSFGHLMQQKDLGKCCKQLMHCYSINRRLSQPMQFHVTSMTAESENEMNKHNGFKNWDCHFSTEPYDSVLPKDKIVYLTSDSNNVIETLCEDKFYVIGGLVDHNKEKGLCYRLAQEKGVSHGKLPLDQYVDMKTRKVLTIDHVFQILGSVASEKKGWKEAFLEVLPERKGAIVKETTTTTSSVMPNLEI